MPCCDARVDNAAAAGAISSTDDRHHPTRRRRRGNARLTTDPCPGACPARLYRGEGSLPGWTQTLPAASADGWRTGRTVRTAFTALRDFRLRPRRRTTATYCRARDGNGWLEEPGGARAVNRLATRCAAVPGVLCRRRRWRTIPIRARDVWLRTVPAPLNRGFVENRRRTSQWRERRTTRRSPSSPLDDLDMSHYCGGFADEGIHAEPSSSPGLGRASPANPRCATPRPPAARRTKARSSSSFASAPCNAWLRGWRSDERLTPRVSRTTGDDHLVAFGHARARCTRSGQHSSPYLVSKGFRRRCRTTEVSPAEVRKSGIR